MKQAILSLICVVLFAGCSIDLTGLLATAYDVDARFEQSQSLTARTNLSSTLSNYSFVVTADLHVYHQSNNNLVRLRDRITTNDALILLCGDLTQCGQVEDYIALTNYLTELGLPYYPVIGNHDLYFSGWEQARVHLGRNCYTFSAGNVRFIAMDSANGTLGLRQRLWLEQVLADKTEPYCVVYTHYNFFIATIRESQQYTDIREVYYLMDLFEKQGVNYVFMGHSHSYDYRDINGVRYVTVDDCVDNGGDKRFVRVTVSPAGLSHAEADF